MTMPEDNFFCRRRFVSTADPKPDFWRADGGCSYCGSISGDEFMRRAEAGDPLIPTDKSYKVYVGDHTKFYFQHLSDEQRQRFVELYNQRQLKVLDGGFYVLPFFMQLVTSNKE